MRRRSALAWRLGLAGLATLGAAALGGWSALELGAGAPVAVAATVVSGALAGGASLIAILRGLRRALAALEDAALRISDGDTASRIAIARNDELGAVLDAANALAETWDAERATLRDRELLLEAVLAASPVAAVLVDARQRVVYESPAARILLGAGTRLAGRLLEEVAASCPVELGEALLDPAVEGLLRLEEGEEVLHLRRRRLSLHGSRATLLLLERLTPEIRRGELALWKRTTRLLCHELANSLAPIASLGRSASRLIRTERAEEAISALAVVEERTRHLERFLAEYGALARLPAPRLESLSWGTFLGELTSLTAGRVVGRPPSKPGRFDPAQLEQALINLTKNALEAGSPEGAIELEVRELIGVGVLIEVRDRGAGFSTEALADGLLPFWTSKQGGSGLGLALVREVVEAHRGRLTLANRPGGGAVVSVLLPGE